MEFSVKFYCLFNIQNGDTSDTGSSTNGSSEEVVESRLPMLDKKRDKIIGYENGNMHYRTKECRTKVTIFFFD